MASGVEGVGEEVGSAVVRERRARMVARASMAPLAPMEWPWRDLVELTGMWRVRAPKTW